MDTLYVVRWDGQDIDTYDGGPVPLVAAVQEFRGVAGVSLWRANGTLVAERIGSDLGFTHAPTGRRIYRRKVNA